MLDPLKLRVLRSVVETGSIRASAEALGYTPSAVSQHLTSLRRETGLDLVERSGRGIVVTAHGRLLAERAGPALDALAALDRTVADLRAGRTGSLRLGYATSIASTWIPELARDVRRRFPDLDLELVLRSCSIDDLIEDDIDVAVGETSPSPAVAEWLAQEFLEEGYVAIVGRDHPLAGRESVQLVDLAEEDWATDDPPGSPWFARIVSACRAAGFTPCVQINPQDFSTVLGFVATGDHVTVQPSLIAQDLRTDLVAVPIRSPALRRRLSVQVRRSLRGHPAARYVVARLHEMAEERARKIDGVSHLNPPPAPPKETASGTEARPLPAAL
ncbi:LysR family transcriptional regulator [Brachybacterium saurashtrense]|uniref:LysR family transcriptional regulator n=1 Tax=Brachybacterium saurashtrense TaxID=556288 RepID=A0A345YRD6_9MICO|nr:LysR family transcriptional regulator [Brachybacterium saurashtrense]AXK46488.1 LysR family transcriptional regulator [Brachybacterium saurashtrense]RRR24229.1 LysR family transcriptional regulator [Brachybacterium saurashtrense]